MARVTVEDCIDKVSNRFDLVLAAAQRARQISNGALLQVERDDDKNPVVALREIADREIKADDLIDAVIQGQRRIIESDESEEVDMSILMAGRGDAAPALDQAMDQAMDQAAPVAKQPEQPDSIEST